MADTARPREALRSRGFWRSPLVRTLVGDPWTLLGALIVATFLAMALLAPLLAPYDPTRGSIIARLEAPSAEHLLGTDGLGRDLLSRILFGARLSALIGFLSIVVSGSLGVLLGALAGYFEGWVDTVVGRLVDTLLAFPGILLAILVLAVLGPGLDSVIIAVGIFGVPTYARVVRATVLGVKQFDFVEAASALGARHPRILAQHVMRNAWAPIIVLTSLNFGTAVLTASALSFLGVGVQPPSPEWGGIIAEGRQYIRVAPHITTITGLFIFATVLGCNLLGDGLRDATNPRTQRRWAKSLSLPPIRESTRSRCACCPATSGTGWCSRTSA
jgi:peptide/nickel transport system permease protein